jgi:hypothetical protein
MVVNTSKLRTWEAEAGVQGHTELYSEILSQNKQTNKNTEAELSKVRVQCH